MAGQKEALSAKDTRKNQKKLREKYSLHNNDFRPGSFWCSCWYFDFLSKQTFFETDASSASYVPPRYILSISTGQNSHFRSSAENQHVLPSQLLLCGDVESNPGPEHTNRETSIWLKATIAQNLTWYPLSCLGLYEMFPRKFCASVIFPYQKENMTSVCPREVGALRQVL